MRTIFVIFLISGCTLNFEINNESGMADNGASVSEGAAQTGKPKTQTVVEPPKVDHMDQVLIPDIVPGALYK